MKRLFPFRGLSGLYAYALLCCGAAAAQGQFSYQGCDDITASQFKYVPLVGKSASKQTAALAIDNNLNEPIHMAFDLQAGDKVDIYFTQRDGTVKKFAAATNTVSTIGQIVVNNSNELGLTGIALDPAFKTNNWVYLFYAIASELRLSRFTLTGGQLSLPTEKKILVYRRVTGAHMGGALAFDSNGDLWISSGNDGSDYPGAYDENNEGGSSEGSSGNMNDLRGGIIRIHPDNSTKGYTVPAGNFGEYWSNYFKTKGNTAMATDYADPTKVKPELFIKGTRNAYSIAVDPVKHWVGFGSIGINVTTSISEAHYLMTRPAYIGYPYFAGGFGNVEPGNNYYALWSGEGASIFNTAHPGLTESTAGPVNNSKWNTGPKQLPPVMPGTHSYLRGTVGAAAITGSFYRYDAASASTIKFPPHFEGAWMITDWVQNNNVSNPAGGGFQGVIFYKVKPTGDGLTDSLKLFQNLGITGPLDLQQGPDGALYVLNYGSTYFGTTSETKIARIEYTGSCHPTVAINQDPTLKSATPGGSSFKVALAGPYSLTIRDVQGRQVAKLSSQGPRMYNIDELVPAATPRGVMSVTLSSAKGEEKFRVYKD